MNGDDYFVLLETLRRDRDNIQNLLFTDPLDIITCQSPSGIRRCFQKMEQYRQDGYWLAGFFSYELGYFLEDTLRPHCPPSHYPLLWFGVYRRPHKPKASFHKQHDDCYFTTPELSDAYFRYKRNILKIKTRIAKGETYQINYTSSYRFMFFGNPFDFYRRLKQLQKVSYSALIHYGGGYIISLSPELFFRISPDKKITVKPMKGTAPAGVPSDWLQNDAKNTSENVMIVDLLRNDLGRICKPGTVRVRKLFAVETYETIQQMTSTVTGQLHSGTGLQDLIRSLFPCGSVTGAPKISSMKIISALEGKPRNIYTGAIGYFAPNGEAAFNVAIRTLDLAARDRHAWSAQMGVGGGIVFDSKVREEYDECRLKAKFLLDARPDFTLIETMLSENGKISCLTRHLRRLKASARYFAIPCNPMKIRDALQKYILELSGTIRLRLLLKADGTMALTHQPLPKPATAKAVIAISGLRTNSDDLFLYHKTTHRKLYDGEYQKYLAKDCFDVIFRNEKDQITEGAISNVFIRIKDRYYTPPVSCGLLSGIGRQILMKKLNARENILTLENLKNADQILLTNSVRGVTEVVLKKS